MPHDVGNWREDVDINYSNAYPQPFERPNMLDVSGQVGEYSQRPGQIPYPTSQKTGFQFPNIGITGILKSIKDQFEYKGATQPAWDPNTGQMISAEEQDKQNALGGYYSDAARYDRRQNKRVRDMLARQKLGKKIGETNLQKLIDQGYGPKTPEVTDRAAGSHRDTVQLDPGGGGGPGRGGTWHGQTAAKERQGVQVAGPGFGKGSYFNQGGRAGYAFAGPVGVEQQTDFIEGPRGDNEFQETVVEGQEQPSREQLEALAMKIFQLPLEELDEQQLLVVYQTAMQGQPMEEAVQEEDVQFAARGGLASLL